MNLGLLFGLFRTKAQVTKQINDSVSALIKDEASSATKVYSSQKIESLLSELKALTDEIAGDAATYSDLPAASTNTGKTYVVKSSTGVWAVNRRSAGLYRSDGSAWVVLSDFDAIASQVTSNSTALDLKEAASNKAVGTLETNKTSDVKFPTVKAVYDWATGLFTKSAIVPNTAPTTGQVLVGNSGGTAYAPQSVSGDAAMSSTGAITVSKATNIKGGNATTLKGAIPYQSAADTTTLLAPNVATSKKFLTQTGDGTNGSAPSWTTLSPTDIVRTGALVRVSPSMTAATTGDVTMSSSNEYSADYAAWKCGQATAGDYATNAGTVGVWIKYDFGSPLAFNAISTTSRNFANCSYISRFNVQVSTDNTNWFDVGEYDGGDRTADGFMFGTVCARYLRLVAKTIVVQTDNNLGLSKFWVYRVD